MNVQPGTLKRLKLDCLGNPKGTVGVCYEDYGAGASFIFPNGNYDGFSYEDEIFTCFDDYEGFCPECADYNFQHVMQLSRDFNRGYFKPAFRGAAMVDFLNTKQ